MAKRSSKEDLILLEMAPRDIDLFNKLIEGYDNLALVTTLDAGLGKVALWVTEHTKRDIFGILKCLPIPIRLLNAEA
jgi:putative protease